MSTAVSNWRAKSPEALVRFMEGGGSGRVELGGHTRLVAPGDAGAANQNGSGATADWLLGQQARRHGVLDKLLLQTGPS